MGGNLGRALNFNPVLDADGNVTAYTLAYLDDYNNKDKSRNLWVSLNVRF